MSRNRNPAHRLVLLLCLLSVLCLWLAQPASAEDTGTGYEAFLEDQADLLTDAEETSLLEVMAPITEWGNVAFLTTDSTGGLSSEDYNWAFYDAHFGAESGIIFLIDMENRVLQLSSDGDLYKIVTRDYMDTITDNVYTLAGDGDYYGCAEKAFTQIGQLLSGKRIAQPMKYITNALLALVLAVVIMFIIVLLCIRKRAVSTSELLEYIDWHCEIGRRTESQRSKAKLSSGSGSGGGHSSGGHSSGRHSSSHSSGGHSSGGHSSGGHSSGGHSSSSHSHSGGSGSHRF